MTTTDTSTTRQICDIGFHRFTGEPMEVRTGNWLEPGDMVCVMVTCAEHATAVGAQSRHWWEHWLDDEGAADLGAPVRPWPLVTRGATPLAPAVDTHLPATGKAAEARFVHYDLFWPGVDVTLAPPWPGGGHMKYRRLLLTVVAIASPVGACADDGSGGNGTIPIPTISAPSLPSVPIPSPPPTVADSRTGPSVTTCPMDPGDADGDGIRTCDYVYDTYAKDSDGDGLVDTFDPYPHTSDWDNDGLPDGSDAQISTDQERVEEARREQQRQEAERERQRQEQRRQEERQLNDGF